MFEESQYELLDFGEGRKLERFGRVLLDRPCPTAADIPRTFEWTASSRFARTGAGGRWKHFQPLPKDWSVSFESIRFELTATETGQVGLFPEQAANWLWLKRRLASRPGARILNLFGYTGGSTLVAAHAGAQVTHVDAAKSAVNWARRNATNSGLATAPIRWIVEDAPKFVAREVRRGNQYDGVILDPPSYGHGPKSEEWKFTRDLFGLLKDCKQVLTDAPLLLLLSCHTPSFGPAELSAALSSCLFGSCSAGVKTRELALSTRDSRKLPAGNAAYWP